MIDFIINYWWLIIVAIAIGAVCGLAIYTFVKKPKNEQLQKVKEWLIYATAEAEKALGGGTGQLKLRYVYDMFLVKFPFLVKVVPFDTFSKLVDVALNKFKCMLDSNADVQNYVNINKE